MEGQMPLALKGLNPNFLVRCINLNTERDVRSTAQVVDVCKLSMQDFGGTLGDSADCQQQSVKLCPHIPHTMHANIISSGIFVPTQRSN